MTGEERWVAMPSGLYLPEDVAIAELQRMRRPRAVDLFAGCGGMSLGAMQGGLDIVAAADNDPLAMMTYLHNLGAYPVQIHFIAESDRAAFAKELAKEYRRKGVRLGPNGEIPEGGGSLLDEAPVSGANTQRVLPPGAAPVPHFFLGDVRRLSGQQILRAVGLRPGELDAVFGGPPCQGFSTAGKQEVMDPRNSLVFEFARLVVEMMPKTMCMENVPGILQMVTPDGVPVVEALARILEDGGFEGYRSFLRSVQAQTGAIGILRSKREKKTKRRRKDPPPEQVELLAEEA